MSKSMIAAFFFALTVTHAESATVPAPVLIEQYGDSTTVGWQSVNGKGQISAKNTPAETQRILNATPGISVSVINKGAGNAEVSQLVYGTGSFPRTWDAEMTASQSRIVTINFALNDAYFDQVKGRETSESPTDYAALMRTVIQTARQHGKIVVLLEPTPSCEKVRGPFVKSYAEQLRIVSRTEKVPLIRLYDDVISLPDWQAEFADCLHPSDKVYEMRATRLAAVLLPIVKKIQRESSAVEQ